MSSRLSEASARCTSSEVLSDSERICVVALCQLFVAKAPDDAHHKKHSKHRTTTRESEGRQVSDEDAVEETNEASATFGTSQALGTTSDFVALVVHKLMPTLPDGIVGGGLVPAAVILAWPVERVDESILRSVADSVQGLISELFADVVDEDGFVECAGGERVAMRIGVTCGPVVLECISPSAGLRHRRSAADVGEEAASADAVSFVSVFGRCVTALRHRMQQSLQLSATFNSCWWTVTAVLIPATCSAAPSHDLPGDRSIPSGQPPSHSDDVIIIQTEVPQRLQHALSLRSLDSYGDSSNSAAEEAGDETPSSPVRGTHTSDVFTPAPGSPLSFSKQRTFSVDDFGSKLGSVMKRGVPQRLLATESPTSALLLLNVDFWRHAQRRGSTEDAAIYSAAWYHKALVCMMRCAARRAASAVRHFRGHVVAVYCDESWKEPRDGRRTREHVYTLYILCSLPKLELSRRSCHYTQHCAEASHAVMHAVQHTLTEFKIRQLCSITLSPKRPMRRPQAPAGDAESDWDDPTSYVSNMSFTMKSPDAPTTMVRESSTGSEHSQTAASSICGRPGDADDHTTVAELSSVAFQVSAALVHGKMFRTVVPTASGSVPPSPAKLLATPRTVTSNAIDRECSSWPPVALSKHCVVVGSEAVQRAVSMHVLAHKDVCTLSTAESVPAPEHSTTPDTLNSSDAAVIRIEGYCVCEESIAHWLEQYCSSVQLLPSRHLDASSSSVTSATTYMDWLARVSGSYSFVEPCRVDPTTGHGLHRLADALLHKKLSSGVPRKLVGMRSTWRAIGLFLQSVFLRDVSDHAAKHHDPLDATMQSSSRHHMSVCLITGDTMSGKTSLLFDVAMHVSVLPLIFVDGQCCRSSDRTVAASSPSRHAAAAPFSPTTRSGRNSSFSDFIGAAVVPLLTCIYAQLWFRYGATTTTADANRPAAAPATPTAVDMSCMSLQQLTDEVRGLLKRVASLAGGRLVVLIDDLHRIDDDANSLRLLSEMAQSQSVSVMVIATASDGASVEALSKWKAARLPDSDIVFEMSRFYTHLRLPDRLSDVGDSAEQEAAVYGAVVQMTGHGVFYDALLSSSSVGEGHRAPQRLTAPPGPVNAIRKFFKSIVGASADSMLSVASLANALKDKGLLVSMLGALMSREDTMEELQNADSAPAIKPEELVLARLEDYAVEDESRLLHDALSECLALLSPQELQWVCRVACFCAASGVRELSIDAARILEGLGIDTIDEDDLMDSRQSSCDCVELLERCTASVRHAKSSQRRPLPPLHMLLSVRRRDETQAASIWLSSLFVPSIAVRLISSALVRESCVLLSLSSLYDTLRTSAKLWLCCALGLNEDATLIRALEDAEVQHTRDSASDGNPSSEPSRCCAVLRHFCYPSKTTQRVRLTARCSMWSSTISGKLHAADLEHYAKTSPYYEFFLSEAEKLDKRKTKVRRTKQCAAPMSFVTATTRVHECDVALGYVGQAWRRVDALRHRADRYSDASMSYAHSASHDDHPRSSQDHLVESAGSSRCNSFNTPFTAASTGGRHHEWPDEMPQSANRAHHRPDLCYDVLCLSSMTCQTERLSALKELSSCWDLCARVLGTLELICAEIVLPRDDGAKTPLAPSAGGVPKTGAALSTTKANLEALKAARLQMHSLVTSATSVHGDDVSVIPRVDWQEAYQILHTVTAQVITAVLVQSTRLTDDEVQRAEKFKGFVETHDPATPQHDFADCTLLSGHSQRFSRLFIRIHSQRLALERDDDLTKIDRARRLQQDAAHAIRELLSLVFHAVLDCQGLVTVARQAAKRQRTEALRGSSSHGAADDVDGGLRSLVSTMAALDDGDADIIVTTPLISSSERGLLSSPLGEQRHQLEHEHYQWRLHIRFLRDVSRLYVKAACDLDAHVRSNRTALASDLMEQSMCLLVFFRTIVLRTLAKKVVAVVGDIRSENVSRMTLHVEEAAADTMCTAVHSPFIDGMWHLTLPRVSPVEPPVAPPPAGKWKPRARVAAMPPQS